MRVLTHRILKNEAKAAKKDSAAIAARLKAGDALNLGDKGGAVSALQRKLKAAGLYTGPVNGTFDQTTADAVAALQKSKGLEESGIVGGKTLKALKGTELFVKDNFKDSAAKVGQSGTDILRTERMLEKLGFRPGKADGIMDADTAKAVERYKKADPQLSDKGSNRIGSKFFSEVSKASRGYNHEAYSKREKGSLKAHKRLDEATAKAAEKGINLGDKGRAVLNVEKHLEAAGYELGKANAQFGSRTEAAVKAFQKHSGLPETGIVDSKTWGKLRGKLFAAKSDTSPAQRLGEKDAAVLRTEKKLKKLGYKVGKVDGLFSSQTQKAVKAFQKRHKIKQTGQVGGGTMKAIDREIREKSGSAAVQKMLKIARSKLGFHERGNNGNPFSAHFGRPAEAWCADFVSYLADKAGLKLNTPSAQGVANYLQSRGSWKGKNNPRPGDAVTFRWDGSGGWADHVGIVEKVFMKNGRKYIQTIEGNSGDAVRRKVYPANSSVINGYGTIK
jgi:peptidoglycan hydrolase-like protein with peptidoglycan-binding domain